MFFFILFFIIIVTHYVYCMLHYFIFKKQPAGWMQLPLGQTNLFLSEKLCEIKQKILVEFLFLLKTQYFLFVFQSVCLAGA